MYWELLRNQMVPPTLERQAEISADVHRCVQSVKAARACMVPLPPPTAPPPHLLGPRGVNNSSSDRPPPTKPEESTDAELPTDAEPCGEPKPSANAQPAASSQSSDTRPSLGPNPLQPHPFPELEKSAEIVALEFLLRKAVEREWARLTFPFAPGPMPLGPHLVTLPIDPCVGGGCWVLGGSGGFLYLLCRHGEFVQVLWQAWEAMQALIAPCFDHSCDRSCDHSWPFSSYLSLSRNSVPPYCGLSLDVPLCLPMFSLFRSYMVMLSTSAYPPVIGSPPQSSWPLGWTMHTAAGGPCLCELKLSVGMFSSTCSCSLISV